MKITRFLSLIALLFIFSCTRAERTVQGKYVIGRDQTWFPLTLGEKTPNVNGFTNALVQELAQISNQPIFLINLSWDQLFTRLDRGDVSAVLTSITPNPENQKKYTFSESFLDLGPVLIVPQHSNVTSLAQLGVSRVGVSQYDDSILLLQKYPSIHIELYENMPTALDHLVNGELDGVLLAHLDAQSLVPTHFEGRLRIVTKPLTNKGLRLITREGENDVLIKYFNDGLEKLKQSSRYDALIEKFNVF